MKTYRIYNIEIPRGSTRFVATYQEALDACKSLGNGWRLPTIAELDFLYLGYHLKNVGGFLSSEMRDSTFYNTYWSAGVFMNHNGMYMTNTLTFYRGNLPPDARIQIVGVYSKHDLFGIIPVRKI